MKILAFIAVLCITAPGIFAFLGIYEPGDTVQFSAVCLEDGGKRDSGCSSPGASAFGPGNISGQNLSFAEVSDNAAPGLWRGNFTLTTEHQSGSWTIVLNLTNTNGTPGTTAVQFQAVGDGRGPDNTGANVVTALSNQAVIQAAVTEVNETVKKINASIIKNLSNDNGFFRPLFFDLNSSILNNLTNVQKRDNDTSSILGLMLNSNSSLSTLMNNINLSILLNISKSTFSSSVSSSDKVEIGRECAVQNYRQNMTTTIFYNFSNNSMQLLQIKYNFTNLGILINETYSYNNESMLNLTNRSTSNG